MKTLHVSIDVSDLEQSISFYSALFAQPPGVVKDDYAKWQLDDPRVNFSISTRGEVKGVSHLGIQVDNSAELGQISERLVEAGQTTYPQDQVTCCYAVSDKTWVRDPEGVPWETFHTTAAATVYGEDTVAGLDAGEQPDCGCMPDSEARSCC